MKTIHISEIKVTDLTYPKTLFYLPMEVLLMGPQEKLPIFPTVRAYLLESDKALLEVWSIVGREDRPEYNFQQKFILLEQDELPDTFGGYLALLNS